jgi:ketosteroid isomerase-like protein
VTASPEQKRNLELAREGFDSWLSGDVEGTLARFADDLEVYVPPELGNAGTYRGKEEFLEWNRQWNEAWAEFSQEVKEIVPVGERHVVVTIHNRGVGRGSGIEVEQIQGWILGVRDGLMDYLSLQMSPELAMELAREREAS